MGIDLPENLSEGLSQGLPPVNDQAVQLFVDMSTASMEGDVDALKATVEEWVALAPERRLEFEQLISMVIPPWILPIQMYAVFSDPEKFMGAIGRLGPGEAAGATAALADATAGSIVLAAIANWLQSENAIADEAETTAQSKEAAKDKTTTQETRSTTSESQTRPEATPATKPGTNAPIAATTEKASADEPIEASGEETAAASTTKARKTNQRDEPVKAKDNNPINQALAAYINSGGAGQAVDGAQTVQFLRNHPILLSGLSTVDPSLLQKAYQIAEGEIIVGLLDRIIEMQAQIREQERQYEKQKEIWQPTANQQLLNNVHKGIHDNSIPLSQLSLMATQLLLLNAAAFQIGAIGMPDVSGATATANITAIASTEAGLAVAKTQFSGDQVATSVLVSLPTIYNGRPEQITNPETLIQLGALGSVIVQMVPYWSIPAAISFQTAASEANAGKQSTTLNAVRAFAVAVSTLINDPAFNLLIQQTILQNAKDPSRITEKQLAAYIAAVKIALLANATVALYVTMLKRPPEELAKLLGIPLHEAKALRFDPRLLADLVLGKVVPMPENDLLRGLLRLIQAHLRDIPETSQEKFIETLFASYSEGVSVDELIDPSKQFLRLCDQTIFRNFSNEQSI